MKTTIKDVASEANVSISTVSRVIRNNPKITEATANRVREAMDKLGYSPNQAARTLITNKTLTIGLIIKSSSSNVRQNPFNSDVLNGIHQECNRHGYSTKMTVSEHSNELFIEVKQMIQSRSVDGFILLYSKENDEIEKLLHEQSLPYIVVGKPLNYNDVIHIDNNNIKAAELLTQYLYNLGHRYILFLREPGDFAVTKDREDGFRNICEDFTIQYAVEEATSRHSINKIIEHYCINNHSLKPTALITSDVMLNLQVLSILYDYHFNVPNTIQTCTFNTSYLTENAAPPQTSVCINPDLLGKEAGATIINLLKGLPVSFSEKEIETHLEIRQSTKKLTKENQ
ncbi:LacI family transcriptional regulator [Staphylococcus pragensis]|uniref:LacI family transcriptional regulator n=1 Tax=Staphylococcus pragensis TaxID=1611836 RepID=A0A4Z1C1P2_9STAP|nr:LacI family DNA-binding transcriptional regulator [Staphylococcus pragensis]RTX87537.1 LacI family transcriptional regulator [Staphylococcus carnosus]TGN28835.1 LacI family transcriptional regulator [Staphylococcus pragensis]GGG84718.1 LacI family transcriptional regulator [Staphylococcus pragensis]